MTGDLSKGCGEGSLQAHCRPGVWNCWVMRESWGICCQLWRLDFRNQGWQGWFLPEGSEGKSLLASVLASDGPFTSKMHHSTSTFFLLCPKVPVLTGTLVMGSGPLSSGLLHLNLIASSMTLFLNKGHTVAGSRWT